MTFGALLRALREASGLSQTELAKRTEVTRIRISEVERGATPPPPLGLQSRWYELAAETLGVTVVTLRALGRIHREHLIQGIPWHKAKAS